MESSILGSIFLICVQKANSNHLSLHVKNRDQSKIDEQNGQKNISKLMHQK